jgi:hypothetical protein
MQAGDGNEGSQEKYLRLASRHRGRSSVEANECFQSETLHTSGRNNRCYNNFLHYRINTIINRAIWHNVSLPHGPRTVTYILDFIGIGDLA